LPRHTASLQVSGRCFEPPTPRDQLVAKLKLLLRVEEMQRADWLICMSIRKFGASHVVSLMKNEQQSQNLLLKVDSGSTFRNNFLQPATNVFVARQADHARRKTRNIVPKPATKQCCAAS